MGLTLALSSTLVSGLSSSHSPSPILLPLIFPSHLTAAMASEAVKIPPSAEVDVTETLVTETPGKRSRGRPPKAKTPLGAGSPAAASSPAGGSGDETPSAKRGRGRPPKAKDGEASAGKAPSATPKASSGRGRGRPPKVAKIDGAADAPASAKAVGTPASSGAKKGRGRPPKAKPAAEDVAV